MFVYIRGRLILPSLDLCMNQQLQMVHYHRDKDRPYNSLHTMDA